MNNQMHGDRRDENKDEDFPAAHSMDTEWFAVDGEGNVGHFTTGEAGAAPDSAMEFYEELPAPEEIIRAFPPESGIEYDVEDLVSMQGGPVFDYAWHSQRYETASFSDASSCYSVLMLLPWLVTKGQIVPGQEGQLLRLPAGEGDVQRLPSSKHLLLYQEGPLPVGLLQNWIQDGLVLKAWVNHSLSLARIGMYEFAHGMMFENWIAGPYLREAVPRQPLKLEQLPEGVRQLFDSTRFHKRSFARDAAIDPREAGECSSWERSWVGLDGVVHRMNDDDIGEADLT